MKTYLVAYLHGGPKGTKGQFGFGNMIVGTKNPVNVDYIKDKQRLIAAASNLQNVIIISFQEIDP